MLKIVVLISGGGSNLQAIIDAIEEGRITKAKIELVISNNPNAYGLERAKKHQIPACSICPRDYETREAFNEELLGKLKELEPDLLVLAGCLLVLPPAIVREFPNKIINIHPALIPAFCGSGFYGLKVHEEALKRGVKVTGATVHFVDEGTDTGPIILQKAVEVLEDDTPELLQRRVMEEAEWLLMPEAINLIANHRIELVEGRVRSVK